VPDTFYAVPKKRQISDCTCEHVTWKGNFPVILRNVASFSCITGNFTLQGTCSYKHSDICTVFGTAYINALPAAFINVQVVSILVSCTCTVHCWLYPYISRCISVHIFILCDQLVSGFIFNDCTPMAAIHVQLYSCICDSNFSLIIAQ
jgi:hypothetical protein